jgi:seryl-tRNA synthetase
MAGRSQVSARECSLRISASIDDDLAEEIARQSAWISPHVHDVHVSPDGGTVLFRVDDEADVRSESSRVERFVADMMRRHRPVPRKLVMRRGAPGRMLVSDAYRELRKRGWAVEIGRGRVSLRGPALAVVRLLDDDCARIARSLGASEESHPALVPASVLARCGYFGSFPHAVSLVTHLSEDYDAIEQFREANAGAGDLVQPLGGSLAPFTACMLPALCYAVYAAREGSALTEPMVAVTTAGRCYRYESRNLVGVERLWEFGMREVVFMGEAERVARTRMRLLEATLDQLERWDLHGTIESANDPLLPAAPSEGAWWQRGEDRKLELRLPIGLDADGAPRAVACASFDLHERFFGSVFRIDSMGGDPVASGRAGWGMERWMQACFAQHGFDPEGWPTWLAERVFD